MYEQLLDIIEPPVSHSLPSYIKMYPCTEILCRIHRKEGATIFVNEFVSYGFVFIDTRQAYRMLAIEKRRKIIFKTSRIKSKDTILKSLGYEIFYGELLGEGSFGKVCLYCSKNGSFGAVKFTRVRSCLKSELEKSRKVLKLLKRCQHPNILSIHEVIAIDKELIAFMDLYMDGDVKEFVKLRMLPMKRFEREMHLKRLFYGLMEGLGHLHGKKIVHRDVKPANILIKTNPLTSVLVDFDFALEVADKDDQYLYFCGTVDYMSPQLISKQPVKPMKTDIWAAGVTCYYMLTGEKPFKSHAKLVKGTFDSKKLGNKVVKMLKCILNPDEDQRPEAEDILNHPWFKHGFDKRCFVN